MSAPQVTPGSGTATLADLNSDLTTLHENIEAHKARTDNPHELTPAQIEAATAAQGALADTAVQPADLTQELHDYTVAQGRPGDVALKYTTQTDGDRRGAPVTLPIVTGARGLAVQATGQQRVALRDRINITDGEAYRLSAQFVRLTNPTDPSGATVRVILAWLNASKALIGETVVYGETLLASAGVQKVRVTFGEAAVATDFSAPANAAYAVPYIQTYDLDGVTLIEQIEVNLAGIEGPTGPPGAPGPRGFSIKGDKGDTGEKGDPGNYLGITLIGSSTDIADRPASANEGDAWGLIENGTIRIYIWSGGAWSDAGPLTQPEDFPIENTLFVSVAGDDANSGTSEQTPLLTIEAAVAVAQSRFDAGGEGTLIKLGPGTYQTDGHIDLPDNTAIQAVHRTVFIVPTAGNEEKNVIRMSSGCFVEGPTFAGWRVDSLDNPTEGFAIAYRPGAVINRVPYAHKIVAYRGQPPSLVTAPLDRDNANPSVGRGMGVCIADGAQISAFSAFPNIMTWGATPSNPNGIGYVARNGALINAVNAVSLWCHKHHLALGGGQIILSSCSTQFGDYSLWAEGFTEILRPADVATFTADAAVSSLIDAAAATIIDDMWDALVANSLTTGWTADDEAFTRRDAAIFLTAVGYAMDEGAPRAVEEFARGLFKKEQDGTDPAICRIVPVFDAAKEAAFLFSFNFMRDEINALVGVDAAAQTAVTNLTAMLVAAIETPVVRKSRSLITAIGHTWTYPLAGVTRSAVPPVFGGSGQAQRITRSVRQRGGGRVRFSGQDDEGNAVFVGGLEINARTGQLGGRPFDSAVEIKAIEAAIATQGV